MTNLAVAGNTGWKSMADAIMVQAAADYRDTLSRLKEQPDDRHIQEEHKVIEGFFHSNWFWLLTSFQGTNPGIVLQCTDLQTCSERADKAIMRSWVLLASKGLRHAKPLIGKYWLSPSRA